MSDYSQPPTDDTPATAKPSAAGGGGGQFTLRLHVSILCIFIALLLAITGLMMFFLYNRLSDTLLLARSELFGQVAARAVERIDRTLRPLESIVEITAKLESLAQDRGAADFHLRDVFIDMQRRYPQLASIYIGYANGEFARVIAVRGNATIRERIGAPPATEYALQIVLRPEEKKSESWTYFNAGGVMLGQSQREMPRFDPRVRPWYKPAVDADTLIKTPPYVFAATGETGFTLARKALRLPGAVIGADIRLAEISAHLDALHPTPNSDIVLFRDNGELLVHEDAAKVLAAQPPRGDWTLAPVRIDNTSNPVLRALFPAFQQRLTTGTVTFEVKGVPHYAHVEKLTLQSSRDEYVAVIAPRSDLLGRAEQIRDRALAFSLALLVIAIPAIAFAAWRIGRPLRALALEAQRIQRFELEGDVPVDSRITEVRDLTRAVAAMKSGLREFARYVPRTLVRDIVTGRISPHTGGDRRTLTVLVSDISNFTRTSENTPPEALMQQISGYFSVMSREIIAHGGTIDKFMGDAVMAFWNAPRLQDDHVQRACTVALALRRAATQLNTQWRETGKPLLPTRFGLHSGTAVVGNVGSDDRLSYTAFGMVVNIVFRIERLNRNYGTEILMTDAVATQCGDTFVMRPVDCVVPRGATEPILLHELMAIRSDHDSAPCLALAERWQPAWTAYQDGNFRLARELFEQLATQFPEDRLSKIYLTRTLRRLGDPDGQDWNGVDRRA